MRAALSEATLTDKVVVGRSGCWEWKMARDPLGYGRVRVAGRTMLAHRAVFEMLVGPVPSGRELDHLCRKPACVNPDHLEPVTHRENLRRSAAGWNTRARTHCPQGHPYDVENTLINSAGSRVCAACRREISRRHKAKKKEST